MLHLPSNRAGGIIPPMPELNDMLTTAQAEELAHDLGHEISRHGIIFAAKRGIEGKSTGIEGCIQLPGYRGSILIPKDSLINWLNNRPKPGPQIEEDA